MFAGCGWIGTTVHRIGTPPRPHQKFASVLALYASPPRSRLLFRLVSGGEAVAVHRANALGARRSSFVAALTDLPTGTAQAKTHDQERNGGLLRVGPSRRADEERRLASRLCVDATNRTCARCRDRSQAAWAAARYNSSNRLRELHRLATPLQRGRRDGVADQIRKLDRQRFLAVRIQSWCSRLLLRLVGGGDNKYFK